MKWSTADTNKILILIVLSYVLFILGNSVISLSNPDEVFYSQTAKEMAERNTWLEMYIFGQPQFEKPILTYWFLRLGIILFGLSSFGARFFSSLFALFGVVAVYWFGRVVFGDRKKAFIAALLLMSAGLYAGMARVLLTDMFFSVLILLAMASFFWGYLRPVRKNVGIGLFFAFSALAVLAKGPLGFGITLLAVVLFLALRREFRFLICPGLLWGVLLFVLIAVPWYIFMINKFGGDFIREFFYNDHVRRIFEAEHRSNDTWYFYPGIMIGGMFPWCLYALASLGYLIKNIIRKNSNPLYLYLGCWIFSVFIIFQPAHSKLVSYILPLFPALALVTGDFICNIIAEKRWRTASVLAGGTWLALLGFALVIIFCPAEYRMYLPSGGALISATVLYILSMAAGVYLIIRKQFFGYMYIIILQIVLMLLFVPLARKNIDLYLSSKQACDYLEDNYEIENTILCAKPFVRGVAYYTDKEVAVVNLGGGDFFSPHPIPFLRSDNEVIQTLRSQPVTYGVLKKSSYGDVKRIAGEEFVVDDPKILGDKYITRIRPKN